MLALRLAELTHATETELSDMGSIPAQLAEGDFGESFGCRHLGPFNLSLKPLYGPGYRLKLTSTGKEVGHRVASGDEVGQECFLCSPFFGSTCPMPNLRISITVCKDVIPRLKDKDVLSVT